MGITPTGVGKAVLLKNAAHPGKCTEAMTGYIRMQDCDRMNVAQHWSRDNSFQTIYNNRSPLRCWQNAASLVVYTENCNNVDVKRAYLPLPVL